MQDSVEIDAAQESIEIGEQVIIAHDGAEKGPAVIGVEGTCPNKEKVCHSFVGFKAEVD